MRLSDGDRRRSGRGHHWRRRRPVAVAGWLGLDQNRERIAGVEEVAHRGVPLEDSRSSIACSRASSRPGYLAWMVHDGEEVHIGVGGYADRFDPARALARLKAGAAGAGGLESAMMVERRGGRSRRRRALPRS
ncbi:MAG: hypothetical protein U0133_06475 [Gemmatimonadales bacterium]